MSASLISGAWINPWYTRKEYPKNGMAFGALASVASWSDIETASARTSHGFTKEKVDSLRTEIGSKGKVLISFGGSAAGANFWTGMSNNPDEYSDKIVTFLKTIGADGIDYDYESELTLQVSSGLATLMGKVKAAGFVQTLCVLAGSSTFYKPIIDAKVADYVMVMCYNGGMFLPGNSAGGGKDWKQWMQVWDDFMGAEEKKKLVVGMRVNCSKYYATPELVNYGIDLCKSKGYAGIFFWWYSDDASHTSTLGDLIDMISAA